MTISTVEQAMIRIKHAEHTSPIAVFTCKPTKEIPYANSGAKLFTVFASTVRTQQQIKAGVRGYIGTYHKEMDLRAVKGFLTKQAKEV